MAGAQRFRSKTRDTYLELAAESPLASIRTEDDFDAAQAVMDRLLAEGRPSSAEELYLDALSDLVAAYGDDHFQFEPASDAEMFRHLMEAKEITQVALHRETKIAKSTISEILAGKRPFSRRMIGTLAEYFDVPKSVLASNL